MSQSMIVIAGKFQVRRGLERELPGTPFSIDPLVLNPGLDLAEVGFTIDTGRVFIGYNPSPTDPVYQRGVFPYQNLEILTENSPRNQELFSGFVRNQDADDFFLPVTVTVGGNFATLNYPDGTLDPSIFMGGAVSVTVEYHAFNVNNQPVKAGTLRILGNNGAVTITDDENVEAISGLAFGCNAISGGYQLTVQNETSNTVNLYLRRAVITLQVHGSVG